MSVEGEHSRTELVVENDPRLVRGVGSVIEHVGERLGLPADTLCDLIQAAEKTCLDILPLIGNHNGTLKVAVQDYADRVEVTVEYPATAAAPATAKSPEAKRLDRVASELKGGQSRITLVKLIPKTPAKC